MLSRTEGVERRKAFADFYFQVRDVARNHAQLKSSGVALSDLETMWWGDRATIAEDLNGYRLWFYQTVSGPVPPEGMKIV